MMQRSIYMLQKNTKLHVIVITECSKEESKSNMMNMRLVEGLFPPPSNYYSSGAIRRPVSTH